MALKTSPYLNYENQSTIKVIEQTANPSEWTEQLKYVGIHQSIGDDNQIEPIPVCTRIRKILVLTERN